MMDGREHASDKSAAEKDNFSVSAPAISLPKGGGAIRGVGEKFAANPVTGTGSMTVPIYTSPGRAGFGPKLSLSYDSGAGNGPFGFGWSLSLPAITRKTDKGLPRYRDAEESDVFLFSGAEDLVPELDDDGNFVETKEGDYQVRRYFPRIEGLFARIERFSKPGDTYWRSISRDNVTTVYGRTLSSRIADPADVTRIFSWLICETYDDKGHHVVYSYAEENSQNVNVFEPHERNRTEASRTANRYLERIQYGNRVSRLDANPAPSTKPLWFFEVVFDYGEARLEAVSNDKVKASETPGAAWRARPDAFSTRRPGFELRTYRRCERVLMFHHFDELLNSEAYLVRSTEFDYADFDYSKLPAPTIEDELAHQGSTRVASFLRRVTQRGHQHDGPVAVDLSNGAHYLTYLSRSLPPLDFTYSKALIQDEIREVDPESLENLPVGLDGGQYQWADLDGEGLSGVLTEQAGTWFYKRNVSALLGATGTDGPTRETRDEARFSALETLPTLPNPANLQGGQQLLDLAGNGQLDVVQFGGSTPGYFERTTDFGWAPFKPLASLPNLSFNDPNLKFVDLTGDGHADLLVSEGDVFVWYESLAERGFGAAERVVQALDEEDGPRVVFADGTQSIYLADMSGDGLSDVVRIRNGEVCYWPNLGYGRFGAKISMAHAPWFDAPDLFDHRRIRIADIDGSGTSDILYLEPDGASLYFNRSGNSFSAPRKLHLPRIDNLSSVTAVDLLGNGTACLVWSSPLPGEARRSLRYVDLMGSQKPHLLISSKNNLGAETQVTYVPSTKFYLADKAAGKPWVTRLPFPVHCVARVTAIDHWRKTEFSTTYSYHHGYFDGAEREFRGFGRVEQVDIESFQKFAEGNAASLHVTDDQRLYQPPVKTITWYHTGAFLDRERILSQFESEYAPAQLDAFQPTQAGVGFRENALPEPEIVTTTPLTPAEWREALRACKGSVLRQEVYELDAATLAAKPGQTGEQKPVKLFSSAYHNCRIQRLRAQSKNRHAVFLVTDSEAITYHYELQLRANAEAPDPRIAHTLNLTTDRYGKILQSVAVVYPRLGQHSDAALPDGAEALIAKVQRDELHVAYTENRFTNDLGDTIGPDNHRLPAPCEVMTYELTGIYPEDASDLATADARDNRYFAIDELRKLSLSENPTYPSGSTEVKTLAYHKRPNGTDRQKRLVEYVRVLYFDTDLETPLTLGTLNTLALPYETYKLALTEDLLSAVFADKLDNDILNELASPERSGYLSGDDLSDRFGATTEVQYWMRSGIAGFATDAASHFYLPEAYEDAFGNETKLVYDRYDLFVASSTDARLNTVAIDAFDFRVLQPTRIKDINDNLSQVVFDVLGMPTATAVMGKGTEADNLFGFSASLTNPTLEEVTGFFTNAYDEAEARRFLGNATARHLYHFGEQREANGTLSWGHRPACASGILRERHVTDPLRDPITNVAKDSPLQTGFEYSDGGGAALVKKSQAEPEPGALGVTTLRWIASGKTVLNNKGKPVKQYEPYFSSSEHRFEELKEVGVTPVMYYDAAGRLIRTELPDGSYSRVVFSPWHVESYDANDTVGETDNAWYAAHAKLTATIQDQRAARLALMHAGTPSVTFLDSLGRDVIAIAHNRAQYPGQTAPSPDEKYITFTKLDAEGKPLWIRDARRLRDANGDARADHRGNLVMQYIQPPMAEGALTDPTIEFAPCYDIAGNLLFSHSMDAGDRFMLNDAAGKPMFAWDENERRDASGAATSESRFFATKYDALHRPVELHLSINEGASLLTEWFRYGEDLPNAAQAKALNLLGQLHQHYDPGGKSTVERCKFSGKPEELQKTLPLSHSDAVVDWSAGPVANLLEQTSYTQITEYDALGRMKRLFNWHLGVGERVAVYEPTYNERGLLASEALVVGSTKTVAGYDRAVGARTTVIDELTYDAKGQRQAIHYDNGTHTRFTYDATTFRLVQLRTTRPNYDPAFPSAISQFKNDQVVQNLFYTYDPVGNILEIYDDAYELAFFSTNQQVEPRARYRYDALYRLIAATGREHIQANAAPTQSDVPPIDVAFPVSAQDPQRQRMYKQRYRYDEVGNILEMHHWAGQERWTRNYEYADYSNRLSRTWLGTNQLNATNYEHDPHGNMLNLANVTEDFYLRWDHRDLLQVLNRGGGGLVYYQYDAGKQRTRKVSENSDGSKAWERIYLAGMEIYRRYDATGTIEDTESHHVFEGEHRVLLVEDVRKNNKPGATIGALYRYQYGNHLGSACLELDESAAVISYDEYHPYGTSAYRTARARVETPKRYRYTGMERDEESGLSYHTARYYVPWLGRWGSVDPAGLSDGPNTFVYTNATPIQKHDKSGRQGKPTTSSGAADAWKFLAAYGTTSTALWTGAAVGMVTGPLRAVLHPIDNSFTLTWPEERKHAEAKKFWAGLAAPWEKLSAGLRTRDPVLSGQGFAEAQFQVTSTLLMAMSVVEGMSKPVPLEAPDRDFRSPSPTTTRNGGVRAGGAGANKPQPQKLSSKVVPKEMLEEYRGEHQPGNNIWPHESIVKYYSRTERARFALKVENGRLVDAKGRPFDTSSIKGGKAIFVVDTEGTIYAWPGESIPGRIHHSSLVAGEPVTMAGEMAVTNGEITAISDKTGHYHSTPQMTKQFTEQLQTKGVNVSKIKVEHWKP